MATDSPVCGIASIGETAGVVWRVLSENGPMPQAKLIKAAEQPRDSVMQAIGWLAREGKITIDSNSRNKVVSLVS